MNCAPTVCSRRDQIVQRDGTCRSCIPSQIPDVTQRNCIAKPEADPGVPPSTGRRKKISLVSISPLDRVLNQATEQDEITVRVGCGDEDLKFIRHDDYDYTFKVDDVNHIVCQDGSRATSPDACPIRQELECGPGQAYTIELFNRNGSVKGLEFKSLGFFKVTKSMLECMD